MGGKSSPAPANTTSSTTSNPWAGAVPYMTGANGIFQQSQDYANKYKDLSPQQSSLNSAYVGQLTDRSNTIKNDPTIGQFLSGGYDPSTAMTNGRTANAAGMQQPATANAATAQTAQAGYAPPAQTSVAQSAQTNLGQSMTDLGGNDPTAAIQKLLSGQPDNPYLMGMHQANINDSLRGYGDAVTNLSQTVLPQLGSQAFASGGYGGSRQGIAEGLALNEMQRNARDLGIAAMDSGNQLFGNAYESAQGRMNDTAGMMTGLASQTGQYNASNQQQANQFNADATNAMKQFNVGNMQNVNLANMAAQNQGNQFNAGNIQQANQYNASNLQDAWKFNAGQQQNANQFNASNLQNADQFNSNLDLQRASARAQNAQAGVDMYKDSVGLQDSIYNQLGSIYAAPQTQYQNALEQYISTISPGAGMGGSSTTSSQIPIYNNSMGQLLGGASSIAGLMGSFK